MKKKHRHVFFNLILPAVVFGSITGTLTALVVMLYKFCAKYVIGVSENGYHYLSENLQWVPLTIAGLLGLSFLYAYFYKRHSNLRGGGIPTSIGILRGFISFHWLFNLCGVFLLSLTSFLVGVPLGNEGPSVQMGTAVGRGSVYSFAQKHRAWDRYSMTGGACSGFAVATGAPVSGIMFAIEEAHQLIAPMIVIVSATSVAVSYMISQLLAPLLGVSLSLFPSMHLVTLSAKELWIPLVVGVAIGLFSVVFLQYYRAVNHFCTKTLKNIPHAYRIFTVLLLTLVLGLVSHSFISTGHHLIETLLEGKLALYMLVLILLVRSTLTLSANTLSLTGGIFLPILALGATLASIVGESLQMVFGLSEDYYQIILVLGIVACISGMMKTPLTAIVFSVEALSCYENIYSVIIVAMVAYIIPEVFGVESINDRVLEHRVKHLNKDKQVKVLDLFVEVKEKSFAVGKQVRDILWPANLFVLSVKASTEREAEMDEHGGKAIYEGDVLHIRYATTDEARTKEELFAIVGEQECDEHEVSDV